jgi:hypothetical protein
MKMNLRITSLLIVIGIFGFSSTVLAQKKAPKNAQPKATAKSATPKKAKNSNTGQTQTPNTTNERPASTGSGDGSNRPESTGQTFTEFDLMSRAYQILTDVARDVPSENIEENSGANAARTGSFAKAANEHTYQLREAYFRETNIWQVKYFPNEDLSSMTRVKAHLEKALGYLNRIEYGFRNNKTDAIEKTEQAIAQAQAYINNPPPPTKTAPNGAEVVKGKGNRKISDGKKAVNTNTIDKSLKTNPTGSTPPAKPKKTTNAKPKASGKTTKPTKKPSRLAM